MGIFSTLGPVYIFYRLDLNLNYMNHHQYLLPFIFTASYTHNITYPLDEYSDYNNEIQQVHDAPIEKVIAFTGCPGCGKTELARRYCREYSAQYDSVSRLESFG